MNNSIDEYPVMLVKHVAVNITNSNLNLKSYKEEKKLYIQDLLKTFEITIWYYADYTKTEGKRCK